jgi:hypothetical protein
MKKKSRNQSFDRSKQRLLNEKINKKKETMKNRTSYGYTFGGGSSKQKTVKPKRYFTLLLKGFFQGMFTFSRRFTSRFSQAMQDDLASSLSQMNLTLGKVMNMDPAGKWELIELLNQVNAFGYELVARFYALYRGKQFLPGLPTISGFIIPSYAAKIINDLRALYRDLVIIYPYWSILKDVTWKSLQYYERKTSQEPMLTRSKIFKIIDSLFLYYLPRLHTLLCYNIGYKYAYVYTEMVKFAGIKPEDDLGTITRKLVDDKKVYLEQLKKEKEQVKKNLMQNVEQKDNEKIPPYVKKGLTIIDEIVAGITDKSIRNDPNADALERNEKMLLFYSIF